jgi:hypothetical protein
MCYSADFKHTNGDAENIVSQNSITSMKSQRKPSSVTGVVRTKVLRPQKEETSCLVVVTPFPFLSAKELLSFVHVIAIVDLQIEKLATERVMKMSERRHYVRGERVRHGD